jgi:ribonuclease R
MSPDPKKLKLLTQFVRELGYTVEDLESRFELQKLLDKVVGQPEQHAVHYAVLRSLQRAIYSPSDEGHYALASKHYCHFTSPIRRYPDLTIHRLVDALLSTRKPTNDFGELAMLGEHCSDRERRAEAAERELTKVKLMEHLRDRIGQEMDAVITGVEDFGLFAQGIELPAEGFIHVSSLQDDYYRFERASHSLTGHRAGNRFRLGDVIRVCVAHVDVDRRELDFRLVARKKRAEAKGKLKPGKRSGKSAKHGKPHKPKAKHFGKKQRRRR